MADLRRASLLRRQAAISCEPLKEMIVECAPSNLESGTPEMRPPL